MALQFFADDGYTEVWNSDNVAGGVIGTIRTYDSGATDTIYFSSFPGRTATIVNMANWSGGTVGVSVNYDLGYPRIDVGTGGYTRFFAVVIQ